MNVLAILDIDAVHWKVVEGDPGKKANASTDFSTNTITIRAGLPLDRYMVCVWHEIAHVILGQRLGLGNLLNKDLDEAVASAFGQGLHQLIENNHHVYRMAEWR